jgi:hypothetical protein
MEVAAMCRIGIFVIVVLSSVPLFALSAVDLAVTQKIVPDALAPFSSSILIDVTNVGATESGPVILTVDLTGSGRLDPAFLFNVDTWTCSFASLSGPITSASCSLIDRLKSGSSAILRLSVAGDSAGQFQSCARVRNAGSSGVFDPNPSDNEDCSCGNLKSCRNVKIVLNTGFDEDRKLAVGSPDIDWKLVSAPASVGQRVSLPSDAVVRGVHSGYTSAADAEWIGPELVDQEAHGFYVYQFDFGIPSGVENRACSLDLQFAVDNTVTFTLDGAPIPAAPVATETGAFTTLHSVAYLFPGTAGTHVLLATVGNGLAPQNGTGSSPTGLLVRGAVQCFCPLLLPYFEPLSASGRERQ